METKLQGSKFRFTRRRGAELKYTCITLRGSSVIVEQLEHSLGNSKSMVQFYLELEKTFELIALTLQE